MFLLSGQVDTVGTVQVDTGQVDTGQVDTGQVDTVESGQVDTAGSGQVDTGQVDTVEAVACVSEVIKDSLETTKLANYKPVQRGNTSAKKTFPKINIMMELESEKQCKIPFLENDTYAVQDDYPEQLIEMFILKVGDSYSTCTLNDVHNNSSRADTNNTQLTCDAWVYDKSVIQSSGPTDFNMVCDNEILRSHSNMIDFAGGSVRSASMEFVGPSKRTFTGMVIEYFWTAGLLLLTGLAYLVRKWRHLRLALGIPPILFVVYWRFATNLIFYGLSLNVGNLSGDIYLNFFISCLMELLGIILCHVLMNKVGRKTVLCSSMVLGGLTCISSLFPLIYGNSSTGWTLIAITMAGKLGATVAFSVIYIFSAELFPTTLRQSAMGSCCLFEGVAGMVAPYIADLGILAKGPLQDVLPLLVFGSLSIAAGMMAIMLPETRDKKLPETIDEAILFGKPTPRPDQYSLV
ncbi:organic cation transporter-like protein [Haliotis rubra]|uniref:organic cation transporter-like protein n=1 Tax=Haliotis rubra TaxID=36100 RepID=UPI001EE634E5|nr:organic cation transporter-like protein [Haliotis rubra]